MISVLAIDDEVGFRNQLASMFKRWGGGDYAVELRPRLPDGDDADFLRRPDPQVILLDLGLPGQSDGSNTVRLASALWPAAPIIVLTGRDVNGEADEWRAAGATNVFNKTDIGNERGFAVLLRAMRRVLGVRGDTKAEVTLSETIHAVESAPAMRKLRRWFLGGGLGALLAGGGGVSWQLARPIESTRQIQPAPIDFAGMLSEHDARSLFATADAVEALRKDVQRIASAVADVATNSQQVAQAVSEIRGYLKALSEQGQRRDERDRHRDRRENPP